MRTNVWFPPLLYSLRLFPFPYTFFIDLITVDGSVSGERTVSVEVIPLAIERKPFPGDHYTFRSKEIGLFRLVAADIPPTI